MTSKKKSDKTRIIKDFNVVYNVLATNLINTIGFAIVCTVTVPVMFSIVSVLCTLISHLVVCVSESH